MIADFNPYPSMKDSGVPWLGEVPAHWELRRTKTLLAERSEKGFPDEPLLAATQTKGVVRKEHYENRTVLAMKDLHLLKVVRVGDFVISLRSFQGGIEYARDSGIISPAYTILYPVEQNHHAYLSQVFKSKPYIANLSLFVTGIRQGQNVDYEKLARSRLPIPPLSEQTAIVRFLDYADRRIRRYIRAKQKLIALLEEQEQAIIHQAVTRGLDPNVRIKPSGVEWLGDVPEHWQVRHLGRIGLFFKGGGGTKEDEREEGIPCVRYGDLYTHHRFFITASRACVAPELAATAYTPIAYGDVLFAGSGETMEEIGKSAVNLIRGPACCGGDVIVFRPSIDAEARFLGYIADCSASVHQKACIGRGFTVMHIYSSDLKYMTVAIPPVPEQAAIVSFLDRTTAALDAATTSAQRETSLLREYHTRLIADVVTGKLDVREASARLPDEVEELEPLDEADALIDGEEEPTDALATAP